LLQTAHKYGPYKIFLLLRQAARHASRARCSGLRFISQTKNPPGLLPAGLKSL
jgi:hypothetical protein